MELQKFIIGAFPEGLSYNDAAQLCLRLYCTVDCLPSEIHSQCTKDNLAVVFAKLTTEGIIESEPNTASLYGANFHAVTDKGHWIEVIASIFKKSDTVDSILGQSLVNRLTCA